jgi:hypothetical protein
MPQIMGEFSSGRKRGVNSIKEWSADYADFHRFEQEGTFEERFFPDSLLSKSA